jgi:hypothetical protein
MTQLIIERDVGDGTSWNMKLGGSLGNVPQKLKTIVKKTHYISGC